MNQLQAFEQATLAKLSEGREIPSFRAGDTVKVQIKVKEGSKERIQTFEGLCIGRKNRGINSSFRVRKILAGEGVERLFPLYSPLISIERVREGIVRRTKLYYLRDRRGKSARIKERRPVSHKAGVPSNKVAHAAEKPSPAQPPPSTPGAPKDA